MSAAESQGSSGAVARRRAEPEPDLPAIRAHLESCDGFTAIEAMRLLAWIVEEGRGAWAR